MSEKRVAVYQHRDNVQSSNSSHLGRAPKTYEYPHPYYDEANVKVLSDYTAAGVAAKGILDIVGHFGSSAVGVDAEWDMIGPDGRYLKDAKPAVLQISYYSCLHNNDDDNVAYAAGKTIKTLVLQCHKWRTLPPQVTLLLMRVRAIVGVDAGGDVAKLVRHFDLNNEDGAKLKKNVLNLGKYSRERGAVPSGRVTLEDLTKVVLHESLEKNLQTSDWSAGRLSPEQVQYAALDAMVSLRIHSELSKRIDCSRRLTSIEACVGMSVDVASTSSSDMFGRVATGIIVRDIEENRDKQPRSTRIEGYLTVRATQKRKLVKITRVYAKSHVVKNYHRANDTQKKKITFDDLTEKENFCIYLPLSSLAPNLPRDEANDNNDNDEQPSTPPASSPPSGAPAGRSVPPDPNVGGISDENDELFDEDEDEDEGDHDEALGEAFNLSVIDPSDDDTPPLPPRDGRNDRDSDNNNNSANASSSSSANTSSSSSASSDSPNEINFEDKKYLGPRPKDNDYKPFSANIDDAFHVMDAARVPMHHTSKKDYYYALSCAMFVENKEDMNRVREALRKIGLSDDQIELRRKFNQQFFRRRVRRLIPSPKVLYERVREVYERFGNQPNGPDGKPLFNKNAWYKASCVLKEIRDGFVSDPPGMNFYFHKLDNRGNNAVDKLGLPLYTCNRGTNDVENVHKQLTTVFGRWGYGIEMSNCLLMWFRHRFNHRASERKRLGFPRFGHYDTWLVDDLQNLVMKNRGVLLYPAWSNSSDYADTPERFGVIPIHSAVLHEKLVERYEQLMSKRKEPHEFTRNLAYVARKTEVPIPFVPVHSKEEISLFKSLVKPGEKFDADQLALDWMNHVDPDKNIYPKYPAYIRTYANTHEKNTLVAVAAELNKSSTTAAHNMLKKSTDKLMNEAKEEDTAEPSPKRPKLFSLFQPVQNRKPLEPAPTPLKPTKPKAISVGNHTINATEVPNSTSKRVGQRGPDTKKRKKRTCKICKKSNCAGANLNKPCSKK